MCVEQEKSSGRNAHYKLTSTVMLWLQTTKDESGTINLGGSLTRQVGAPLCHHVPLSPCVYVTVTKPCPSLLFAPCWLVWNGRSGGRVLASYRQHRPHGWSKFPHIGPLHRYSALIWSVIVVQNKVWNKYAWGGSVSAVFKVILTFLAVWKISPNSLVRTWRTRFAPRWMKSTSAKPRTSSTA